MSQFSKARVKTLISILCPNRLTRVLDIGANPVNKAPYHDLMKMGGCEVWGFEPQKEAFRNLIENKSEFEHYFPHAIGDGRSAKLHTCSSDGFSSILPPNIRTLDFLGRWHKAMTIIESAPIETKRLDDLDEIPQPDLLKIDVQGAEKMIFEHAFEKLSSTCAIITEVAFVPLYEDQPLYQHQALLLEKQGYALNKFLFLKKKSVGSDLMSKLNWRKHQNQVIDGDALFTKNLIYPDNYSDEQFKHLAICADAIFESFDLVLKCLSELLGRGVISELDVERYIKQIPFQK